MYFVPPCRLTLILVICASQDFNRAFPSGLIVEEWTRQLLEIIVAKRDYRVTLSEENLTSSGLWAFVEERKGHPLSLLIWFCLFSICDMRYMSPLEAANYNH